MDLPKRIYTGREVDRLYRDLLRAEAGSSIELPDDPTLFYNGEGEFVVPPSGGSLGIYMPDARPATPHADDNEFTTTIADLTEVDHDGIATWSRDTGRNRLQMELTRSNDAQSTQMVKNIPASEFSVITKVGQITLPVAGSTYDAGILVAEGTGATDNFLLLSSYQFRHATGTGPNNQTMVTAWGVRALHFSSDDVIVNDDDLGPATDQRSYLRIAVNGDDIWCYTSVDGQNWNFNWLTTGLGWTPTKVGVGVWCAGSGGSGSVMRAHWDFLRFKSGAGSSAANGHQIGELC